MFLNFLFQKFFEFPLSRIQILILISMAGKDIVQKRLRPVDPKTVLVDSFLYAAKIRLLLLFSVIQTKNSIQRHLRKIDLRIKLLYQIGNLFHMAFSIRTAVEHAVI